MQLKVRMRSATKQGSKHIRLNMNNQDAVLCETFSVPAFNKTYWVGLVADGSTGNPLFSHTEVGSQLEVLYAFTRIQELICAGMPLDNIPIALYPSITEFLRDLMNKIMPDTIVWPYPAGVPDRGGWSSQKRFRVDYLAATLLGFICDGEKIVTFTAGDGIKIIDNEVVVIDQDDRPDYPAVAINQAGAGFETESYSVENVQRIAMCSDGLKHLAQDSDFVDTMFGNPPDYLGLQYVLNKSMSQNPELMKDDCTAFTWEILSKE